MLEKGSISQEPDLEKNIKLWINDLGSSVVAQCLQARLMLIRAGAMAVPALIQGLSNGNPHTRWEAACALTVIKDASAAAALLHALEDENHDVRWAAMEGLIALGRAGLEPLLQALMQDFDSVWLREGAHHILNVLKKQRQLRQPILWVLQALDGVEPEVTVPWAAKSARESLFGPGKEQVQ